MKKRYKKLLLISILLVLMLASTLPAMGASDKVRVFVEFSPGAKGQVQQLLNREGAQFHYTFDDLNSFVVTVPAQALKGLSRNPNVVDIEEDVPRFPVKSKLVEAAADAIWSDVAYGGEEILPWGVQAVQAPYAWDAATPATGAGVTVCIIDTGYYDGHEDLPLAAGGMAQLDDPYTVDGYGHGTHVAGTIAALDNQVGVIGVSPDVNLYIIKYFGDDGLATQASDLIAAAFTCRDNGADIISMSLSGTHSNMKEQRAFDLVYAEGLLSVGAASNDGIEEYHYPASYESVISVAALDANEVYADFSQFNDAVEIAAPGVGVLSTIPYLDSSNLIVDGVTYAGFHVEFSGRGDTEGPLMDGGLCDSTGSWTGAVVLCSRGVNSFAEKIQNVEASGGVAAMIYNNIEDEELYATMGEESGTSVIGIGFTMETGQYLVANKLGLKAFVHSEYTWPASGYEHWGGTSMATPHVSAVAALLWSAFPDATNVEIREAMNATAKDLGDEGRDVHYGFGLVQAKDALDYLSAPPSTTLNVSVSTDLPVYADKDNVYINVDVSPGSAHQENAEVTVVILAPNGKVTTLTGLTDANGEITFKFKALVRKYDTGAFDVNVTASLTGFDSGYASTSFIVE